MFRSADIAVHRHDLARKTAGRAVIGLDQEHGPVVQRPIHVAGQHDMGRRREERPCGRVVDDEGRLREK